MTAMMKKRIVIVALCLTLFAGVLVAKLFFIQVLSGDYYQSLAQRQQVASRELTPRRGDILLHDGKTLITAATTRSGWLLYADARKIEDGDETFGQLTEVLRGTLFRVDQERFFAIAEKHDDPFEILIPRIEDDIAKQIDVKNIPGIGLLAREWRYYPLNEFASHIIGFFGFGDDGKEAGQYGIERFYNSALGGKRGIQEGNAALGGAFLTIGKNIFLPPQEGDDITLTIEFEVQQYLEHALDSISGQFSPEIVGGLIINPQTGKIFAMAARNNFNPNTYASTDNLSYFLNPVISSIFELGSVFKPLTIAAALDAGVITPETDYIDEGFVQIADVRISNYDRKARGKTTIQGILNESLNTGAVFVQKKLGKEKFLDYFERYGLDTKTDIDLPFEAVGDMSNLNTNRDVEFASASFGQGLAVTPIEFVRAVSALANGGFLITPYIVENGHKPSEPKRILSQETSETISRMLVTVVDKALLGGGKGPGHYTVAAKTGTAQIPNAGAPGYSSRFFHSFFGYAPAFDPKFLIFLFMKDPKGIQYASHSLGPSFLELTRSLLYYYEVPPDR